jgi:membrane fusion protein (multidrug efflux system)
VDITTEIAGKIQKIHFEEGKRVNKGDLLISINNDELQAQYDKLKFNQKLRKENEFRQRQLLQKEAISQEEYDISLTEFNTSIADVKLIEAQLDKTSIRAPFSGTIGLRSVSEGAFVNSNTRIAYLASVNPAKVEFSIPGKYSNAIKIGDEINFLADGISTPFKGKVYAIDPQIDQNTRTMKLRAVSENANGLLLPGQFARVELKLKTSENAIMLPNEAVVPEISGHKVYVFENGKAKEKKVQIGVRTATEIEITEGLVMGDTVIVSGILIIKNGSNVEITNYN